MRSTCMIMEHKHTQHNIYILFNSSPQGIIYVVKWPPRHQHAGGEQLSIYASMLSLFIYIYTYIYLQYYIASNLTVWQQQMFMAHYSTCELYCFRKHIGSSIQRYSGTPMYQSVSNTFSKTSICQGYTQNISESVKMEMKNITD